MTPVPTLYFMGGLCEETDGVATKYYATAGMTVAMHDASGMKYLLTDHLGSVDAVADANGNLLSQQRYLPALGRHRPGWCDAGLRPARALARCGPTPLPATPPAYRCLTLFRLP